MPLPTPHTNNPSRLEQLFRTAQELQDLLTDDEIQNIVRKEMQPLSTPTTAKNPFIPRFQGVVSSQRLLTTFMISAAILTSVVGLAFLFSRQ